MLLLLYWLELFGNFSLCHVLATFLFALCFTQHKATTVCSKQVWSHLVEEFCLLLSQSLLLNGTGCRPVNCSPVSTFCCMAVVYLLLYKIARYVLLASVLCMRFCISGHLIKEQTKSKTLWYLHKGLFSSWNVALFLFCGVAQHSAQWED